MIRAYRFFTHQWLQKCVFSIGGMKRDSSDALLFSKALQAGCKSAKSNSLGFTSPPGFLENITEL